MSTTPKVSVLKEAVYSTLENSCAFKLEHREITPTFNGKYTHSYSASASTGETPVKV